MTESGRPRILVVEDAALVAMLLEEMLDDLGFDVIGPATDYASACQMAREPGITAAILDVNLHGRMSWDVAGLLKEANVPFAFSTGYDSATMLPPHLSDVPVLTKPFDSEHLERQIHALVAQRTHANQPSRPTDAPQ
jgi:two-component system, chemotaxis family, sensor kinase Cph1